MENIGYQQSDAPPYDDQPPQQGIATEDDAPPAYPQNPAQFEGYANIGFCNVQQDTDYTKLQRDASPPVFQEAPFLTEDDAREALAKFVSEHCCYGSGPVKKLTFKECKSSNTYRYVLETFTETRMTQYVYEPYHGQVIISNGMPPPQPWDIIANPIGMFADEVKLIEIPNTAHVESCTKCGGSGVKRCHNCWGRGRKSCFSCNGNGFEYRNGERISCCSCHGSGWQSCNGSGRITCHVCRGSGRLKWYLQLKIEFKNNKDDFFKKSENIPDELLRKCLAKNIFAEQNLRVFPITNHQDAEINNASLTLINLHANRFTQCRILAQRHQVDSIPVTLCNYKFNDDDYEFRVYGLDNKVFAPDYPRKCCCCSIL